MSNRTTPRQRLTYKDRGKPVLIDPDEYTANESIHPSRMVGSFSEKISVDICLSKHYMGRDQIGNDDGSARDGIGSEVVKSLVSRAFGHLLFYSSVLPNFPLLNYKDGCHVKPRSAYRAACQEDTEEGTLNVIIEVHCKGLKYYEITVLTAVCKDNFYVHSGEYIARMDQNNSVLYRQDGKNLVEVCSI